jgi:hypothetical protein
MSEAQTMGAVTIAEPPPLVSKEQAQPTMPLPAPAEQQAQPATSFAEGKTIVIPNAAMKRIKEENREKGRKQAMDEFNKLAQENGFASPSDMFSFVKQLKETSTKAPEKIEDKSVQAAPVDNNHQYQEHLKRLEQEKDELLRKSRIQERKALKLERDRDAIQVQMTLRESAMQAGIKDPGYAVNLLQEHIDGKTETELKDFDSSKFFSSLRTEKPYLFGEYVRPATTGVGLEGGQPSALRPNQVTSVNGSSTIDMRKASQQELTSRLRQLGLRMPTP